MDAGQRKRIGSQRREARMQLLHQSLVSYSHANAPLALLAIHLRISAITVVVTPKLLCMLWL